MEKGGLLLRVNAYMVVGNYDHKDVGGTRSWMIESRTMQEAIVESCPWSSNREQRATKWI